MTLSWAETTRRVIARADNRCEYCRMHQSLQGASFHIEHVQPQAKGGSNALDNLALACPSCNLAKSDRTSILDPDSLVKTSLFNPRIDVWEQHFTWESDYALYGITSIGRATVVALQLNGSRRQLIREAEEWFDLFPP